MKLVLLPQAQADLDAISDPLLGRVLRRIEALRRYPMLGAALYGPFAGYRATVVGNFRVVYRQTPQILQVCYVRDGRRSHQTTAPPRGGAVTFSSSPG